MNIIKTGLKICSLDQTWINQSNKPELYNLFFSNLDSVRKCLHALPTDDPVLVSIYSSAIFFAGILDSYFPEFHQSKHSQLGLTMSAYTQSIRSHSIRISGKKVVPCRQFFFSKTVTFLNKVAKLYFLNHYHLKRFKYSVNFYCYTSRRNMHLIVSFIFLKRLFCNALF